MPRYRLALRQNPARSRGWIQFVVLGLLFVLGVTFVVWYQSYARNLRPVSDDTTEKVFVISSGATVSQIGNDLAEDGLIRKAWAFERYVTDKRLGNKLQAGTYKLAPSMSTQQIATAFAEGTVAIDLITIVPGQRIDQIRQGLIAAKFDPTAVDTALHPAKYADISIVANIPAGGSLEGFLYPDSYQKDATTDPTTIVRKALLEMETKLTSSLVASFSARGLNVYQAVTLASIVEKEVAHPEDRTQVAQVFYKRLAEGKRLESDATAIKGAVLAGQEPSILYNSVYNTYKNDGLPPGPISNVSEASLKAVASPATTDWLYFVSGDNGTTYFSRTLAEHEALTAQHCRKLCGN